MIRIDWDDHPLDVQRLVVRRELSPLLLARLRRIAVRSGLFIVSPAAVPQAGDFWLGCTPDSGWGGADASEVGWAGLFGLDDAIRVLETTADEMNAVAV